MYYDTKANFVICMPEEFSKYYFDVYRAAYDGDIQFTIGGENFRYSNKRLYSANYFVWENIESEMKDLSEDYPGVWTVLAFCEDGNNYACYFNNGNCEAALTKTTLSDLSKVSEEQTSFPFESTL